jgi:uncharacterized damage-inducible protein DinB
MSVWQAYRDDVIFTFRKHKQMAEKAITQLDDRTFFLKPGEHSNSIAAIIKHLSGNFASRFTDFLTTDGDKPWRDRDGEFIIGDADTREKLLADWENGWGVLFAALEQLTEADWLKTVSIRGEEHTVLQAIHRAIAHTAYHVGQITYLARLMTAGEWKWITIPPGQSKEWNARGGGYLKS